MKARPFVVVLIVLLAVAAVAAFVLTRGGVGGRLGANLSQGEQALLRTLSPEQRRDVLSRYTAAKQADRKARLADHMPETAYSVKVATATRATLQSYLDVNGDVTTETTVSVFPDIGGRLVDLRVALGDRVSKDEVIAQVDPSKPGASYALASVRAPITGTITDISAPAGSTVTTATPIARVGILDAVQIAVQIRERDVGDVLPGLRARARFEAFPGESFALSVFRVSPVLDASSRTRDVVLRFDAPDGRILPGMFARVRLYTRAHAQRVTVPVDALVERYGEYFAYVAVAKEGVDRAELRRISRGVTVDELAEIVDGIAAGERVVVAGQAALGDGALLRIVSTDEQARDRAAPGEMRGRAAPGEMRGRAAPGERP